MYLADHAWPDLASYFESESLALVPVGSTEQHGPHLPEATDALIAEGFAREAAERTGFLCTPTVSIGVSPHHRQFPGTMWVDGPAFRTYMESLTRNLAYHGIDRVIYVNAHGGNVEHLREVGRRLHEAKELYAIEWMWDESITDLIEESFDSPGPHGGPKETSLVWHLASELVHEGRIEEARDGGLASVDAETGRTYGARTFYDAIDNSDNGVFGDQTDASPDVGEKLFEAACENLVALAEWLDDQPLSALLPRERLAESEKK